MDYDALDHILASDFLDIIACNNNYPAEALKAVSKPIMRSLMKAKRVYYQHHGNRDPRMKIWFEPRRFQWLAAAGRCLVSWGGFNERA